MDDEGLARQGRAARARASSSGGTQNEIYEIRRGDLHGAMRIPPPTAPGRPRRRHPPRVAHHRGARRHRRARTPRPSRVCEDPSVLGRTFYLMGFVDGWSPMDTDGVAGAVRHRPRGPQGPRLPAGRGHRAARRKVDWQAKGLAGPRPARRLPRAPGRPVDRVPRAHQGPRAARASTRRRRGCGRTSRSTSSPGSCTATTSSPT